MNDNALIQKLSRSISRLAILPVLFLLPASITFIVMNEQLESISGGQDSPEFTDISIRWGMSGGLTPFIVLTVVGSILWLIALVVLIRLIIKDRQPHWGKTLALLFGFISHIWVLGRIWDFVEKMIR